MEREEVRKGRRERGTERSREGGREERDSERETLM